MDHEVFKKDVKDLTEADWKMITAYVHNLQHIVKVQIDLLNAIADEDEDEDDDYAF